MIIEMCISIWWEETGKVKGFCFEAGSWRIGRPRRGCLCWKVSSTGIEGRIGRMGEVGSVGLKAETALVVPVASVVLAVPVASVVSVVEVGSLLGTVVVVADVHRVSD